MHIKPCYIWFHEVSLWDKRKADVWMASHDGTQQTQPPRQPPLPRQTGPTASGQVPQPRNNRGLGNGPQIAQTLQQQASGFCPRSFSSADGSIKIEVQATRASAAVKPQIAGSSSDQRTPNTAPWMRSGSASWNAYQKDESSRCAFFKR